MSYSTFPTIKHETPATRAARGEAAPAGPLTFDAFRAANVARCLKWHPEGIESWSPSDWLTAVTGELGELASLLKMRNRERDGLPGNKFSPTQKQIADELADVATYLDLLAEVLGVNLGRAVAEKFNEVSERVGFPDRIPVPDGVAGLDQPQQENSK
jgi:NTP pyrophosphatase (non-canonical NTP hydrolase)